MLMRTDKRLWLLNTHEVLNSALRRVINVENGALNGDYMLFDSDSPDCNDEREYIQALNDAESELNKALDKLESICSRWRVVPEQRCPR